jgi:hypothetical protein
LCLHGICGLAGPQEVALCHRGRYSWRSNPLDNVYRVHVGIGSKCSRTVSFSPSSTDLRNDRRPGRFTFGHEITAHTCLAFGHAWIRSAYSAHRANEHPNYPSVSQHLAHPPLFPTYHAHLGFAHEALHFLRVEILCWFICSLPANSERWTETKVGYCAHCSRSLSHWRLKR